MSGVIPVTATVTVTATATATPEKVKPPSEKGRFFTYLTAYFSELRLIYLLEFLLHLNE